MTLRTTFRAAVLAFALLPLAATACDLTSWSSVTTTGGAGSALRVGGPTADGAGSRYAGLCAMTVAAAGNFVTDESPASEAKLHARFYVLAQSSASAVTIFQASNAAGTSVLSVRFNGTAFEFATRGAHVASQPVQLGHWYSVQLSWTAGAVMTATVRGAGQPALPTITTSASQAADRIDRVNLGWIDGTAGGPFTFDAYESRRATPVPRLCRGNADANRVRNERDQVHARGEFLEQGFSPGQPDCNEDGKVDSGDLVCIRNMEQSGQGDCDAFPDL